MPVPPLSLNVLQIQTPCDADWHAMPGTAAKRHCADCDLHVHDLASLPRRKAEKLLERSQTQRVCARVTRDARGRIITRNRWRSARRRLAAAAGLALSVTGLTGCGDDNTGTTPPAPARGTIAPESNVENPTACDLPQIMGEMLAPPLRPEPHLVPLAGRIAVMGDMPAPPPTTPGSKTKPPRP